MMIFNRKRNTDDGPNASDDFRGHDEGIRGHHDEEFRGRHDEDIADRPGAGGRRATQPFDGRERDTGVLSNTSDDTRGYRDEPVAHRARGEDRPAHEAYDGRGRSTASDDVRGYRDERAMNRAVEDRPSHPMSDDRRPNTADIANARDDVRHRDERGLNRPGVTAPAAPGRGVEAARAALFSEHDTSDLKRRWSDIQADFIDDPRRAVEHAESLVGDVMKRLRDGSTHERGSIERQQGRGDKTEELLTTLRRYRSFFDRILST